VRGFDLIVCIDFLLRLTEFLTLPPEESPRDTVVVRPETIAETARVAKHSLRTSAKIAATELVPVETPSKCKMQLNI